MSDPQASEPEGQVSETARLDPENADTPISDSEAVAGYPDSESGQPDEPDEAGPNANPHRDQDTR